MTLHELVVFIPEFVRDFLAAPENNNLGPEWSDELAWQDFVIGYSSGTDDMYKFWKDHIGSFHWTPAEAFAHGLTSEAQGRGAAALAAQAERDVIAPRTGGDAVDSHGSVTRPPADALTVISWAVSRTEATKADNRREDRLPSERWARTRIYG